MRIFGIFAMLISLASFAIWLAAVIMYYQIWRAVTSKEFKNLTKGSVGDKSIKDILRESDLDIGEKEIIVNIIVNSEEN